MRNKVPREIKVGDTVCHKFGAIRAERIKQTGKVLALGRKYRGAQALPAAKVKMTSRVLWYLVDQLEILPEDELTASK